MASLGSRSRQAEPSQSFAMQLLSYNHNFIKHIFTKAFSTLNCIVITAGWAWRAGSEGAGEHSTSAHLVVASQGERITITNMLAWSLCRSLGLVDCFLLGSERDRARGSGREVGRWMGCGVWGEFGEASLAFAECCVLISTHKYCKRFKQNGVDAQ